MLVIVMWVGARSKDLGLVLYIAKGRGRWWVTCGRSKFLESDGEKACFYVCVMC